MLIIDPRQRIRVVIDDDGPEHERAWFEVRPLTARMRLWLESLGDQLRADLGVAIQDIESLAVKDRKPSPNDSRAAVYLEEIVNARFALQVVGWGNVRDAGGAEVRMARDPVDVLGVQETVLAAHLVEAIDRRVRYDLIAKIRMGEAVPEEVAKGF